MAGLVEACRRLRENDPTLTCLYLDDKNIGDDDAMALAEALKSNTKLQVLILPYNNIGNDGATALADALKSNTTLQSLSLPYNNIGDDGAVALAEALKSNTKLQWLHLGDNKIGNDGARVLLQMLREHNATLIYLYLDGNNINEETKNRIAALVEANKDGTRNPPPQPLKLEAEADDPRQSANNQPSTRATKDSMFRRKRKTKEQQQRAETPEQVVEPCRRLRENDSKLTELNLYENNIGKVGATALAEALKSNNTLQWLYLWNNDIGNYGAAALAEALKNNTKLETLHLYENNIGNDGAVALAEALKSNTALQTLDLSNNMIGNDGATALAEALKNNTTLQVLYLPRNKIGKDGAAALAEALKSNTILQELNLGYNKIGKDGATALAEALKSNTTLTRIDLRTNNIGNAGDRELLQMLLKHNGTLTRLDLDFLIGSETRNEIDALVVANKNGTRNPPPQPLKLEAEGERRRRLAEEQAKRQRLAKTPAVLAVGERLSNANDSPQQQPAAVIHVYDEDNISQTMALLEDLQGSDVSILAVKDIVEILGNDVDLFQTLLVELKSSDFACDIKGYKVELTELLSSQRDSNEDTRERQCIQQSELDYEFYLHLQWKLRSMIRASECLASGMVKRGGSSFRHLVVSVVTEDGFVEALKKINLVKTLSAGLRTAMRQFESVPGMHAARKVVELFTEFREMRDQRLSVARVAVFSVLVEIRGGPSDADLGMFVERVARLMVRARAQCLLPRRHVGGIRKKVTPVILNVLGDISTSSGGQQGSKAADELFRIIMGRSPPEGSTFTAACEDAFSNVPLAVALVATLLNVSIEDLESLERFSLDSDDGSASVLQGNEFASFSREAPPSNMNPREGKETSGTAFVTREELEAWTKKQEEHDKLLRRLQSSDENGKVYVDLPGGMKQVLLRKPPSDEQETEQQHQHSLFELQERCLTLETLLCELTERLERHEISQDEFKEVVSQFKKKKKKGKRTGFWSRSRS